MICFCFFLFDFPAIQRSPVVGLALCLSLLVATSPTTTGAQERAPSPPTKENKDWIVGCEGHGLCHAANLEVSSEEVNETVRYRSVQETSELAPVRADTTHAAPQHDRPATQPSPRALNKLRPPNLCGMSSPNWPMLQATFHRLDARMTLALLPPACTLASHNFPYKVVLLDNLGRREAFEFDTTSDALAPDMLTNAVWRSDTLRLESTHYYGMRNDCGKVQSFTWDGRRFRLIEIRELSTCHRSQ